MSYQDGKVYRIDCEDHFYFGSCITTLGRRATTHRYRTKTTSNRLYDFIRDRVWTITLVKLYPCESKEELLQEEDKYIREALSNPLCLNERSSVWDKEKDSKRKKEWYEANKERITKEAKEYYQAHKEECDRKNKEYNQAHKEEIRKKRKEYYQAHKAEINKKSSEARRKRRELKNQD